jgi:LPS-assembly lipoprotein
MLLSGCGFQMRGTATVPPEMAKTYIETNDRFTLFYRELRNSLRRSGVEIVDTPAAATATFTIQSEVTGQRVLSVSARNVPREFEVYYSVYYGVVTSDKVILTPREQTLTRDYIWDETLVLGKEKEEQLLREAVVEDLIRVILIQLSSL